MSSPTDPDAGDLDGDGLRPRLVVLPVVRLPRRVGEVGGLALVTCTAISILAGVILSWTLPLRGRAPRGALRNFGPSSTLQRLSTFTSVGASLTVALALAVGLVLIAMSGGQDSSPGPLIPWRRAATLAAVGLATIIFTANVAMILELFGDQSRFASILFFPGNNRAGEVLQRMAPVILSAGVVVYAVGCLRRWPGAAPDVDAPT